MAVQSQLRWEEVGRENWGSKIFLEVQMPGSRMRVVLKLFLSLLNFVVGFLLSFC